jgi:putative ABC transport system permease protein
MDGLLQDLRLSLRLLAKQPRAVLVIVITLALGIGATTAVFSVVNSALLKPLPYQGADQIVMLVQQKLKNSTPESSIAPANFIDIRDNNEAFELVAAHVGLTKIVTGTDEAESLNGIAASASLFLLLGVNAQIGRTFSPEEDKENAEPVVVISNSLWHRRFKGDASILNKSLNLDGRLYTVVGIMPSGFDFPKETDFWIPLEQQGKRLLAFRNIVIFSALARLKTGISVENAQAQMDVIGAQLETSHPATNKGVGFQVIPLQDFIVGNARSSLLLLLAATGLLLLIACVNVTNIFLARAIDRRREVAIRIALGNTRLRMIRQFLCECLVITFISGALGVLLATRLIGALSWLLPADHPNAAAVTLDLRVLALTVAISLISGIVFGLIAARHSIPKELMPFLKEGPITSVGRKDQHALWNVLVVTEIALSMVLCISAGLLMNSFLRLVSVNPGFDPSNLLIVSLRLNQTNYKEEHRRVAFCQELMEKLSLVHEVESSALSTFVPMGGHYAPNSLKVEGRPQDADSEAKAYLQVVGGDYFGTLKITLRSGRLFSSSDGADAPKVAIVNEAAVQQYFSGDDPIGKNIMLAGNSKATYSVVGVVGNIRQLALEKESVPEVFLPYEQAPWAQYSLILKTKGNPTDAISSVRSLIRAVDPDVPLTKISTMDKLLAGTAMDRRLKATAFNIFAMLGCVLAAVGLYGLLSHWVRRRTREIGVRMALGATGSDMLRMILRRGTPLITIGVVVGVILSLFVNRLFLGLLYGVSATDLPTILGVCLLIVITGLTACYIPAYRATKVDPVIALRNE